LESIEYSEKPRKGLGIEVRLSVDFFKPRRCCAAGVRVVFGAMCLAIPGRVTSISGEDPLMRSGKVDFGGVLKEVSLAYVPEVKVGDYVIVHVGFALSRVDEAEANQVFEYLREMQELTELEDSGAGVSPASPVGPPAVAATFGKAGGLK
jgi:hydrogenase expression/formation protein HypC